MTARRYRGHVGIGSSVTGPALVASDNFSARYDLDRIAGTFSRPSHRLFGESYLGKVLVLNVAKGGVATAWMLYEMAARDRAPLALVLNYANPIMAQGAAHADFPLIDRFDCDITRAIRSGETITVDPAAGTVTVHS
jgi:predicted aconitase with swiveling domain